MSEKTVQCPFIRFVLSRFCENLELYSINVWVKNENKGGPAKFVQVKDSRICSEHFSADMFEVDGRGGKAVLKPYAVPQSLSSLLKLVLYFVLISYYIYSIQ